MFVFTATKMCWKLHIRFCPGEHIARIFHELLPTELDYQVHLWTGCYFPFSVLHTDSVKQLEMLISSDPLTLSDARGVTYTCSSVTVFRLLTLPQSLIVPPQVSICPTDPVSPFTADSHTASLCPKSPQLKLQWTPWVSGSLTQPNRHQSQGNKGSTPVTLRNASGEKKLISSAGSQPRGVLRGDWSQWEALLGGGYKSSLNPMTQQSWVRVRWHFAAI